MGPLIADEFTVTGRSAWTPMRALRQSFAGHLDKMLTKYAKGRDIPRWNRGSNPREQIKGRRGVCSRGMVQFSAYAARVPASGIPVAAAVARVTERRSSGSMLCRRVLPVLHRHHDGGASERAVARREHLQVRGPHRIPLRAHPVRPHHLRPVELLADAALPHRSDHRAAQNLVLAPFNHHRAAAPVLVGLAERGLHALQRELVAARDHRNLLGKAGIPQIIMPPRRSVIS